MLTLRGATRCAEAAAHCAVPLRLSRFRRRFVAETAAAALARQREPCAQRSGGGGAARCTPGALRARSRTRASESQISGAWRAALAS